MTGKITQEVIFDNDFSKLFKITEIGGVIAGADKIGIVSDYTGMDKGIIQKILDIKKHLRIQHQQLGSQYLSLSHYSRILNVKKEVLMDADAFDTLAMFGPIVFGGLFSFGMAFYFKIRYGYRGGIKSTGTLIGFRQLDDDHYYGALMTGLGQGKYKDFNNNKPNRRPIIRFSAGGQTIEQHSDWAAADLERDDIGRELPIRYFPVHRGRSYRVILEGKLYEQYRKRRLKITVWILAGFGIAIIALAFIFLIIFW